MTSFSQGKYALAISDRSGMAFPYNEMVKEWNGALVHISEYEPKQPQLQPKPTNADPQALQRARPARTEFPTEDFLPNNPITTTATNTTLKIDFPNGDLQVNDFVRLRNVKSPVGGVPIVTGASGPALELSTTLDTAATHADGDAVAQSPRGMTDIQEANYRVDTTSVDTPMTRISRSQYQAFSNKTSLGLPTQYWVQRFVDKVTMTLYLTPGSSQAGDFINFYYTKRIDDVGAYTNATDVPYRFVPCMIAGLAFYLSTKYAPQREQGLKMLYEDELKRAESEDGSSNSTYISPKIYFPGIA